jgi:hypothetical protein
MAKREYKVGDVVEYRGYADKWERRKVSEVRVYEWTQLLVMEDGERIDVAWRESQGWLRLVKPVRAPSNGSITARLRQQVTDLSADVEKAKDETKRVCKQLDEAREALRTRTEERDLARREHNACYEAEQNAIRQRDDWARKDVAREDIVESLKQELADARNGGHTSELRRRVMKEERNALRVELAKTSPSSAKERKVLDLIRTALTLAGDA